MRRSSRSNRNILLWMLSLIVAVSMVCGLVISVTTNLQRREATPVPTPLVQTETPTPTPTQTPAGPMPSPQPLATSAP